MWSSFLTLSVVVFIQHCLAGKHYGIQSIKVDYEYDKKLGKDIVCEIKIIDTGLANFTVGGTFLNDANDITVTFQIFVKKNRKYVPHMVSLTVNVCDLTGGNAQNENSILKFLPNLKDFFSTVIRPCPYSGRILLENYEIDGVVVSKFLKPGAYRFDFRAYNENNQTFIAFKYFAILNRKARAVKKS